MADDDHLVEALRRALVRPEEPPPGRLSAFLAGMGRERRQSRVTPPKLGWLAAGGSVVAALAVLLLLALPGVLSPRGNNEAASSARAAVARLRTALAGGDPIAVAEADADLLRAAGRLPVRDVEPVRGDAVSAHTQAVVFLRDNPAPIEFAPRTPDDGTPVAAPPPGARAAPTVPPARPPVATSPPTTQPLAAPTTLAPVRSVAIRAVTAELDGGFQVEFTTTGFTPGPGRAPGTHAVRFSFDSGQAPTVWTGSSPWVFPLGDGLLYRQVCAEVVDDTDAALPASGGCHPIG